MKIQQLILLQLIIDFVTCKISCDDYYASVDQTAKDDDLKLQLKTLINPHTVYTYDEVWNAFLDVDKNLPGYPCDQNLTYITDIYSSYCWSPEKITPGGECGNYKREGDCYNREHIWPKSWFGGFDYGENAQTDLYELWPSDGYVNGLRGDLPLGNVIKSTVTYNSSNGCLIGECDLSSFSSKDNSSLELKTLSSSKCFEVTDMLKGDIARSYFYFSTAYWNEWECCDTVGVNRSDIKPWMESILRSWHILDPVDDLELERNGVIYENWQGNRNPFIDHPEWVEQISDF